MGKARDEWSKHVTETLTDLRLNSIQLRPRIQYSEALIRAYMAECIAAKILMICVPLLSTLATMEKKVGVLADLRREPWAAATHPVNERAA